MKRKIIQGITLLVFASLVTAFIVYRIQASGKIIETASYKETSNVQQTTLVKTDSIDNEAHAAVVIEEKIPVHRKKETDYPYVDTENTEVSGYLKGKDVLPKTEHINLAGDSSVEDEMPIMSGSKVMIVKDWKFDVFSGKEAKKPVDFSKTLTKKKK